VDDVNILTYSTSIKRNCENLEKAYIKCINWAKTHGSKFNPEKSELIHFIKYTRQKRLDKMDISLKLEGSIIEPSKSIRILGVYLDQGLTANTQLKVLQKRIPALLTALKSLTQSTWGTSLQVARDLYLRAIRPTLSYGATAWFPILKEAKTLRNTLKAIQGKFLRIITGAYRATATEALEIETFIEPLDLYIERIANLGLARQVLGGQGDKIKAFRRRLALRVRGKRGRRRRDPLPNHGKALEQQKRQGIHLPNIISIKEINPIQEWNRYKKALEAYYAIKWRIRWLQGERGRAIAKYRPYPTIQALELYKDRAKAFSTILILLRTEKIGLRAFLYGMKVPGINNPQCNCQQQEETVRHFLLECTEWDETRSRTLGSYSDKTLEHILGTRKGSKKAVDFLLQTKRLEQFQAVVL
jgi:hypothetical protein